MLVDVDVQKAYNYFQAAAGQDLADAQVNLAKMHIGKLHLFCSRYKPLTMQNESNIPKLCSTSNPHCVMGRPTKLSNSMQPFTPTQPEDPLIKVVNPDFAVQPLRGTS
jgi:hypothetical protein